MWRKCYENCREQLKNCVLEWLTSERCNFWKTVLSYCIMYRYLNVNNKFLNSRTAYFICKYITCPCPTLYITTLIVINELDVTQMIFFPSSFSWLLSIKLRTNLELDMSVMFEKWMSPTRY